MCPLSLQSDSSDLLFLQNTEHLPHRNNNCLHNLKMKDECVLQNLTL